MTVHVWVSTRVRMPALACARQFLVDTDNRHESAGLPTLTMSHAVHELQRMLQLLRDIGCVPRVPVTVWCDNQAAIRISEPNGSSSSSSKHIDVRRHHVREAVAQGVIEVKWVASEDQLADVCTGIDKSSWDRALLAASRIPVHHPRPVSSLSCLIQVC